MGGGGAANIGPGGTQRVWLDFSASIGYSGAMRDQVVTGFQDSFDGFDATFSLTQPTGPFTRIIYDGGGAGGVANEIDFRNLNPSSFGFVGTDVGSVTNAQRVNYAVNVGSHELGHTLGLRHHDSFGPIGTGIPNTGIQNGFLPSYPGPRNANEFFNNIMSTPALGGSFNNFFTGRASFGERSLTKLAFATDGLVYAEQGGAHGSIATAQLVDLEVLTVPNSRPAGTVNAGIVLPVRAASVVGNIGSGAQSDFYSFEGFEGDFLSIEAMTTVLTRFGSSGVDSIIEVFDSSGNTLDYYGTPAINDGEVESLFDSHIFDLILPADDTYYIEVSSFGSDTGNYELFMFTFGTVPEPTSLSLLGLGGLTLLRRRR